MKRLLGGRGAIWHTQPPKIVFLIFQLAERPICRTRTLVKQVPMLEALESNPVRACRVTRR